MREGRSGPRPQGPAPGSDPGIALGHWEGEPVGVWASLWGIPRLEAWTLLPSTNDRALELGREGAAPWTVVVAEGQRAGRGRAGRRWRSPRGAGLYASVILRSRVPARASLLPLLTGCAVARAVEADAAELEVGLKWPNDLWIEGRKVGGILCEAAAGVVVAGVGVNLRPVEASGAADPPGEGVGTTADVATLEGCTDRRWSGARLLGRILGELGALWDRAPLRFEGEVAREWASRDLLAGRRVRIGSVQGIARGIDADGALVVEGDDGRRRPVRAGHVEWDPSGADLRV